MPYLLLRLQVGLQDAHTSEEERRVGDEQGRGGREEGLHKL